MRIGIDLDNTLACYDEVFAGLARECGASSDGSSSHDAKRRLRDELRALGREDQWTELQGRAYGPLMANAVPFPGAVDFWRACRREGVDVFIVSHRTLHPYRGPRHDLHAAAREWLASHGFAEDGGGGSRVFLETTIEHKAERIARLGCTHFVDDLEPFLRDSIAGTGVVCIHFDPSGRGSADDSLVRVSSWDRIAELLLGGHRARP
jgi:hypothetical protein